DSPLILGPAARITLYTRGGIPEAELTVAFNIPAARSELCAVERRKQPTSAHLTGNRRQRILSARRTRRGVLRRVGNATAGAAVGVAHQHAPEFVHRDVVEIEQIAARIAPALVPDAATLHCVGGSCVNGRPGSARIVSERHIEVPDALE